MRIRVSSAVLLLVVAFCSCKTTTKVVQSTKSAQPEIAKPEPNVVVSEDKSTEKVFSPLAVEGQKLFFENCDACHDMPVPAEYTFEEWSEIMVKMSVKSYLNSDETKAVMAFLKTSCKK